jgi:hypothetical protein
LQGVGIDQRKLAAAVIPENANIVRGRTAYILIRKDCDVRGVPFFSKSPIARGPGALGGTPSGIPWKVPFPFPSCTDPPEAMSNFPSRLKSAIAIPFTPGCGDYPQGLINNQIVDDCDILIAAFWSRLGTATPVAPSGTAEEIGRLRERSKNVLLYFSSAPSPQSHDPEQWRLSTNLAKGHPVLDLRNAR